MISQRKRIGKLLLSKSPAESKYTLFFINYIWLHNYIDSVGHNIICYRKTCTISNLTSRVLQGVDISGVHILYIAIIKQKKSNLWVKALTCFHKTFKLYIHTRSCGDDVDHDTTDDGLYSTNILNSITDVKTWQF